MSEVRGPPREGLLGLGAVGGSKLSGGRLGVTEVRRLLLGGGPSSTSSGQYFVSITGTGIAL